MADWFGETPVVMQESSPSHFTDWVPFCNFCDRESVIYCERKYLCIHHAEEIMMEFFDND